MYYLRPIIENLTVPDFNEDSTDYFRKIIENCVRCRKNHNITQKEIAETSNVSQSAISKFENGHNNSLSLFILYYKLFGEEVLNGI